MSCFCDFTGYSITRDGEEICPRCARPLFPWRRIPFTDQYEKVPWVRAAVPERVKWEVERLLEEIDG
jgi:hypothetical protein